MPKKKAATLPPGKGAKASLLTKFIKPSDGVANHGVKDHRSVVELVERGRIKMAQVFYYRLDGDGEEQALRYASTRWFKVVEEGSTGDVFKLDQDSAPPQLSEKAQEALARGHQPSTTSTTKKESTTQWKHSMARKLLYNDVYAEVVPRHAKDETGKPTKPDLETIFLIHDEYTYFCW